jgi:hypothetical protein
MGIRKELGLAWVGREEAQEVWAPAKAGMPEWGWGVDELWEGDPV